MNMQTSAVIAPPAPRGLEQMQLPLVMMRDILLKTIFRKTCENVSEIAAAICLPIPVTQELVDIAREQKLLEATGTLNANAGNEMGYQLTDAGKARAHGCPQPVGILRRHAGPAGGLPRAGQAPVDPQHPGDPRPA